ncbi:MAG: sugar phosphate isomerase/epimerase [Clostridia bacterium]|nr:sugar phosphate isomerase/epimerase [Clostridia bacterium]
MKTAIASNRRPGRWQELRAMGYDAVDYNGLAAEPGCGIFALSDEEFEQLLLRDKAEIEAAGLEICQTHGVWPYDDTKPEQKELKFEAMVKSIRGTAIIGSEYVIVHPVMPFGWNESPHHEKDVLENIEYMKKLVPYAEKYNVKIALENMPNPYVPCGKVEELAECIDAVNNPYLVACLDVGHSTAVGCDAGDAVRILGKRLHCLHVHDNDGKHDFHWLPYYGATNWTNFTEALKEIGYAGCMSIETSVAQKMRQLPDDLCREGEIWLNRIAKKLAKDASL